MDAKQTKKYFDFHKNLITIYQKSANYVHVSQRTGNFRHLSQGGLVKKCVYGLSHLVVLFAENIKRQESLKTRVLDLNYQAA